MGVLSAIRSFFYEPAPQLAPGDDATPPTDGRARGADGVMAYGGYVQSNETNPKLQGAQKWTTYANAINAIIVATGVRYFGNLIAGSTWHVEPNPAGGAGAERGAEIVRRGLLEQDGGKSWAGIAKKAAIGYRMYGFSLHATGVRWSEAKKQIVFDDIAHRPQHTIQRWLRDDPRSPFRAVVQQVSDGATYEIPLHECLYCVDDTLGDGPDGVGLLRHIVQHADRLTRYQTLEWLAYEGGMAGLPIARAPLEELTATETDDAKKKLIVDAATATLKAAVANRVKQPDKLQWLMLDSATYRGLDSDKITAIQKWAIEIVKSELEGVDNLHEAIKRLQFEIARLLGIEFALVGSDGGSYSMHEDKTSMFAVLIEVTLAEIAQFATRQLARRLVMLNGLDPELCTPTLVAEPVNGDAIGTVTKALVDLTMAKLHPLDPARPIIRKRLRLPAETAEMLPDLLKAWEAANSNKAAPPAVEDDDDAKEAA